jgi:hypothetical protein
MLLGGPLPAGGAVHAAEPARQGGTLAPRLTAGSFGLALTTSPAPIPFNEPFELGVTVQLLKPVDDPNPLWLNVRATMPAHGHGMNTRVRVEDLGGGRFNVKGLLFHMAGEWEVVFQVAKGRVREDVRTQVVIE